ncbi:MAG: hypothetical protein K9M75_06660 [Phycisphaerae bacterium]|nr:hypothetical protein [Phycisphaerae bacterium]
MGLFAIFKWKKKNKARKRKSKALTSVSSQQLTKVKAEIENLNSQIGTLNIILQKHDQEIMEHSIVIKKNSAQLKNLEQLVTQPAVSPVKDQAELTNRPITPLSLHQLPVLTQKSLNQGLDIDTFSAQEKNILTVFFQNRDMALSYSDIASALNKSPNTVKNQMRQINAKANLFNKAVDSDNRNRFKLCESLKIEKYLNTN